MGDHGINHLSVPNKTLQTQPLATRAPRQVLNKPHRALHRPIKQACAHQASFVKQKDHPGYGWKLAGSKQSRLVDT